MTNYTWQSLDQNERSQFWATLALKYSKGIGPRLAVKILRHFGSAFSAIQQLDSWQELGINKEKINHIASGKWKELALAEWQHAQKLDAHIILWHHKTYPNNLKKIIDAPAMLYARGDTSLLNGPCLAIVGSRRCTAEGIEVAGAIARNLSQAGITIVSGMAQGIDRVAHMASLHKIGKSIAVLGTGVDVIYPQKNTDIYHDLLKNGLIISEFQPKTSPLANNFPIRNRIISGISLGVLVVEGSLRSGTLITARQALEQNRDVFAIPGPTTSATSQGCQELIRQGAKVVFSAEDILCDLSEQLKEYTKIAEIAPTNLHTAAHTKKQEFAANKEDLQDVSSEEREDIQQILKFLHSNGESHVDTLCMSLEKPAQYINTLLMNMELIGLVKRLPGAKYTAKSS